MSQKGQGEKPKGGPPVPPPPRRQRTSGPPTPGDVTSASVAPPRVVEPEPPTTIRRLPRHASPELVTEAKVPSPKITIRDNGPGAASVSAKSVPDSGPSIPKAGASPLTGRRRLTIRGSLASGKTGPDSGPSSSSPLSKKAEPSKSVTLPSPNRSSSQDARPQGTPSSRRVSFPSALPKKATDAKDVTIQEVKPSTSSATKTDSSNTKKGFNVFKKKSVAETRESLPPTRRRHSIGNVAQSRAKTNRILYTTDEEVRDALVEFSVFIIFLVLTSLVTLSVRHSYMFYFNDTMRRLFTTRELVIAPSVTVCFEKLITVPDWWDYLVYNFLITLHGDMTFLDGETADNMTAPNTTAGEVPPVKQRSNNTQKSDELQQLLKNSPYNWDPGVDWEAGKRVVRQAETDTPTGQDKASSSAHHLEGRIFLYENLLLGPPRLRQIRVRKESCYVNDAFIRYFNTCYSAYSSSAEEKSKYQGIKYRTMKDLDTTPLWTVLTFYRSGGYVVNLDYDKNKNLAIITGLKDQHWLDRGSRLSLVEFNLYNENTDIFQSVKLIAEIPPTGGVIPQAHLQTVKRYSFFTDRSMVMTVIYIFWYIMIVYYTIYEITEIRKSGCKNYFLSILNMLDCIILLLCYFALVYNVWHTFKVSSVTNKAKVELTYQSLDVLCFWNIIYVDMMAILAFLVWIKIFKFISFNKTLVQFTTTLKRCSKDLAGFSLMFGIVFLAYAQLGLLLFGTKHPDFRNFITSILTMIRMILGDFQYNLIEQANRVLGPIYFLTYILLVFFILLNMFLAIIMETYNTVKSEITQGRSHLGSYIYRRLMGFLYLITHCGRKRRPPRELTAEEAAEAEREAKAAEEEPQEMRKNLTPAEARYFQEIPPEENKEFVRLSNRVGLLEEILEKLITNMDDILKRVEKDRAQRRRNN